ATLFPYTTLFRSFGISNDLVVFTASSRVQLFYKYNHSTQPLCSDHITSPLRSYRLICPSSSHWYSRLMVSSTCTSPLASKQLVPAVPHKSPNQNRAIYTPDVTYTVTRFLVDFFFP